MLILLQNLTEAAKIKLSNVEKLAEHFVNGLLRAVWGTVRNSTGSDCGVGTAQCWMRFLSPSVFVVLMSVVNEFGPSQVNCKMHAARK